LNIEEKFERLLDFMDKNGEDFFFFLDNVDELSFSDASFFPWI